VSVSYGAKSVSQHPQGVEAVFSAFYLMIKKGYQIRAIPVFIEKIQLKSFLTTLFLSID